MPVHHGVTPSIKFTITYLYTWVERGNVREKCLAYELNTMTLARARTWTTCSGVVQTNQYLLLNLLSMIPLFSFTVPYCSNCILLQPKACPQMAASYFSESFLFIIVNSFDNKTLMKWIDCHVQHFLYKESALVDRFDALAIT